MIKVSNNNSLQLLLVRRPCATYHIERQKVLNSSEIQDIFKQYDSLFKELTEITGQKTEDLDGVQDIYSTLLAEVKILIIHFIQIFFIKCKIRIDILGRSESNSTCLDQKLLS